MKISHKRKSGAQSRYQYENIRGHIELPAGWDKREYISTDAIQKSITPFYESLDEWGIFDALHEEQKKKRSPFATNKKFVTDIFTKEPRRKNDDDITKEIEIPEEDE